MPDYECPSSDDSSSEEEVLEEDSQSEIDDQLQGTNPVSDSGDYEVEYIIDHKYDTSEEGEAWFSFLSCLSFFLYFIFFSSFQTLNLFDNLLIWNLSK